MKIAEDVHVIEHRRVQGGGWVRVQTVGDDMLEWAEERVVAHNEASGCGDWRIRTADAPEKPKPAHPVARVEKPSLRDRAQWRWIMLTSKRGRR